MKLINNFIYWFKNSYWTGKTPILIKAFIYILVMVYSWGVLNYYDWSFVFILKKTLVIWFVGWIGFYMADKDFSK